MQVHESLIGLVGNTPLIRLRKVTRELELAAVAGDAGDRRCWPRWSTSTRAAR